MSSTVVQHYSGTAGFKTLVKLFSKKCYLAFTVVSCFSHTNVTL